MIQLHLQHFETLSSPRETMTPHPEPVHLLVNRSKLFIGFGVFTLHLLVQHAASAPLTVQKRTTLGTVGSRMRNSLEMDGFSAPLSQARPSMDGLDHLVDRSPPPPGFPLRTLIFFLPVAQPPAEQAAVPEHLEAPQNPECMCGFGVLESPPPSQFSPPLPFPASPFPPTKAHSTSMHSHVLCWRT